MLIRSCSGDEVEMITAITVSLEMMLLCTRTVQQYVPSRTLCTQICTEWLRVPCAIWKGSCTGVDGGFVVLRLS